VDERHFTLFENGKKMTEQNNEALHTNLAKLIVIFEYNLAMIFCVWFVCRMLQNQAVVMWQFDKKT
jgi:hypothetical protein